MRPSGKINLIGVAMLLAISAGLYWVVMFAPKYLDNMDIKTAVDGALLEAPRNSDEGLVQRLVTRANSRELGWHLEEDADGNKLEVAGLGFTEDNVSVTRNEVARTITIVVDYQRDVHLIPTERWTTIPFHVEKSGPLP